MSDTLFTNARIFDGSGAPPYSGEVLVQGNRIRQVRRAGAGDLRLVCLVAAPEGVAAVRAADPDVPILAATLDRGLDERGYIRPGLGDAGDRLFGTE